MWGVNLEILAASMKVIMKAEMLDNFLVAYMAVVMDLK